MREWLSGVAEVSGVESPIPEIAALIANGAHACKTNATYAKAARLVRTRRDGFLTAVGLMQVRVRVTVVERIRSQFYDVIPFDVGLSLHSGRINHPAPENMKDPSAQAGFWITHGGWDSPNWEPILKMVANEPEYRIGASVAMQSLRESRGLFQKLAEAIGIGV